MSSSTSKPVQQSIASESFHRALNAFRNRLEPHELALFQQTSLLGLKDDLETIQKRQEVQKSSLGMGRLKGYLEAIEQLGRIVEVFLNVSDAVAFIWGPVKLLLQTGSTWTSAFDKLLDAYQSLGENFPLVEQYEHLFGTDHKMQRVLELLYCDILEFHRRAVPFIRKKVWNQMFRAAWNDFGARFNEIISSIARHTRMLESQAQLIHYQNDDGIKQLLLKLEKEQEAANEKLERSERDRRLANTQAVQHWIGAASSETIHKEACDRWTQYPGTGEWLLRKKQISRWMTDEIPKDSMFWLHGIPGAGKTILTSLIIENCRKLPDARVVYFYCKFDDEQKTKYLSILKALLSQMIALHEELVPYCWGKSRDSRESILSDEKLAKDLFESACYQGKRQYIIVDGLDECSQSDRKNLLSMLTTITRKFDAQDPGKIRVLVTSQTETDIARSLSTADYFEISPSHVEKDISTFVSHEMSTIKQKFELDDDQVTYVEQQVNFRAAGQFLYARLVLDNLGAQPRLEDFIFEIQTSRFPIKLTEAYQRILDRVQRHTHPDEWKYILKILGWMVRAARPMKWTEIQAALSIDSENEQLDFVRKKLRFHIKDVCGSFVGVDDNDRTTLVHSTAKTFITETEQINPDLVEFELATACLQYLALPCFDKRLAEDTAHQQLITYIYSGQYAFQDYAIAKWEHHYRQATVLVHKLRSRFEEPDYEFALQLFADTINDFAFAYREDITPVQDELLEDANPILTRLEALQDFNYDAWENATKIYKHVKNHAKSSATAFNDIPMNSLRLSHEKARDEMEKLPTAKPRQSITDTDLTQFYGHNYFKCPKLTCYYFHQGFVDAKSRQIHLDRHTRPFQCPVNDCNASEFGFITKNNLTNHIRTYHPELEDKSKSFPVKQHPIQAEWEHVCNECNKRFSRRGILREHQLAHAGQKPHQCSRCPKSFTRRNDRDRHERTIHVQRARLERSFP